MLKAKRVYDTMPQVVDCADRSSKILETLQTVYKDAQEKMKNGEYELALKEFEVWELMRILQIWSTS